MVELEKYTNKIERDKLVMTPGRITLFNTTIIHKHRYK